MKTRRNNRKADSLLALALFAVFAACLLSVLLTGADAYKSLSARDRSSYDRRTAGQYLSMRLRQADRLGDVAVITFGGGDALLLTEEIDGVPYETLVYCHNGWLRELFAEAGGDFAPGDGEAVLEAEALELSLEGQVLTATLTDPHGGCRSLTLYLRSREGAAP